MSFRLAIYLALKYRRKANAIWYRRVVAPLSERNTFFFYSSREITRWKINLAVNLNLRVGCVLIPFLRNSKIAVGNQQHFLRTSYFFSAQIILLSSHSFWQKKTRISSNLWCWKWNILSLLPPLMQFIRLSYSSEIFLFAAFQILEENLSVKPSIHSQDRMEVIFKLLSSWRFIEIRFTIDERRKSLVFKVVSVTICLVIVQKRKEFILLFLF